MKYIVNILLFLIMIYSLTVMPIDMKALQVDVSWEKYKAIEEKKETEKQQQVITETVKTSQYELAYSGETYLFNPSEIKLQLSGDEKLPDLQADVLAKLTFEWLNAASGTAQILQVPAEAITIGPISGTTVTKADVTIKLTTLSQIPDGQYTLKIRSQSELTNNNPDVQLDLSWFKKASYAPFADKRFGSSAVVTYYYPTPDGTSLIPITEGVSNVKVLRKIATKLYTGQTTYTDLKTGPLIPRIRNIQLKAGKLNLFTNTTDIEAAKANGLTPKQMTDLLTRTYFSLPYIEEINFFVDGDNADTNLAKIAAPAPVLRASSTGELYQLTAVGPSLYFTSTPKHFATTDELLAALISPDVTQKGKLTIQAIPVNVRLTAVPNPEKPKQVTVDLQINGDLYGGQKNFTQMMLDTIALNLVKSGLAEEVLFTVDGKSANELNQVPILEAYTVPTYINVKSTN